MGADTKSAQKSFQNRAGVFIINNKSLILVLIIMVVISCVSPAFLTYDNLKNVIRQISINAILGVAFTFVLAAGSIDLSVGSLLAMLGIVAALLTKAGLPFGLILLLVVAVGCFCGMMNGLLSVIFNLQPFLLTIATAQIFKGTAYLLSNGTPLAGLGKEIIWMGQGYVFGVVPAPVLIMALFIIVGAILLYRTEFGRYTIAIGGNAEAARVSGVNLSRHRVLIFVIVGICTAVVSLIMDGRVASAQPTAGQGIELDIIAAVVIGGTSMNGGSGKIIGTIFGCLIIGLINNSLNLLNVNSFWQMVAKGVIILLAIILDANTAKFYEKLKIKS
ncbi:ribose ABC transporter permease [Bacteroidia bacterium]|nr:ribose ABC transporter permease [Bacteroidia bacterium]